MVVFESSGLGGRKVYGRGVMEWSKCIEWRWSGDKFHNIHKIIKENREK